MKHFMIGTGRAETVCHVSDPAARLVVAVVHCTLPLLTHPDSWDASHTCTLPADMRPGRSAEGHTGCALRATAGSAARRQVGPPRVLSETGLPGDRQSGAHDSRTAVLLQLSDSMESCEAPVQRGAGLPGSSMSFPKSVEGEGKEQEEEMRQKQKQPCEPSSVVSV